MNEHLCDDCRRRIDQARKTRRREGMSKYYFSNRVRKAMAAKVRYWQNKGLMGPPPPVKITLADKLAEYRRHS